MAHPRGQDTAVKEKVASVREVVPSRSNNEIVLVLQYYDYSVENTIQAFLEDGAKEALQEWHFHGNKPNNKKKRKNKKKEDPKPGDNLNGNSSKDSVPSTVPNLIPAMKLGEDCPAQMPILNGTDSRHGNGLEVNGSNSLHESSSLTSSVTSVSLSVSTSSISQPKQDTQSGGASYENPQSHQQRPKTLNTNDSSARERTWSEKSTSSSGSKRPYAGLEKSVKDLQRQTSSLQRLDRVLAEELDRSYKSIKEAFDELRLALSEREADVLFAMDKVKIQANDTLSQRRVRAAELKVKTDRAQAMKEEQLGELRSDIKQFVSDRKVDEDLSRTTRFNCDVQQLLQKIQNFGEVVPVKHQYNVRRPSASSISSSVVSHDDLLSPTTPGSSVPSTPLHHVPPAVPNSPFVPPSSDSKLNTTVTDSATLHDLAELQQKFQTALKLQGLPTRSPTRRNPANPRPQSGNRGSDRNKQNAGPRRPQSPNKSIDRNQKQRSNAPQQRETGHSDSHTSPDSGENNKSRNARRRQARRERDRERRQNKGKDDKSETPGDNVTDEDQSDTAVTRPTSQSGTVSQKTNSSTPSGTEKQERNEVQKANRTPSPTKNRPRFRGPRQHSQDLKEGKPDQGLKNGPGRGQGSNTSTHGLPVKNEKNPSKPEGVANGNLSNRGSPTKGDVNESKPNKSHTTQIGGGDNSGIDGANENMQGKPQTTQTLKTSSYPTKSNAAVVSVKAELSEKGDAEQLNNADILNGNSGASLSSNKPNFSRKPRPRHNTPNQDQVKENNFPNTIQNGIVENGTESGDAKSDLIPNHVMEKALPQRKPRDRPREVKRVEVIVNGNHPEVNGTAADVE